MFVILSLNLSSIALEASATVYEAYPGKLNCLIISGFKDIILSEYIKLPILVFTLLNCILFINLEIDTLYHRGFCS
jgi:hypothetical protein